MVKNLVSGTILALFAQIWDIKSFFFFFLNLAAFFIRCNCQLSSCMISGRTNNPILKKLTDGQIDEQTDNQTAEGNDSTGPCPTNVERPKK